MSDFAAPVRENASGLRDASPVPVLAPQATPVPANPVAILAAQPAKAKGSRTWVMYAGGGLLAAQIFLPTPVKPLALAGEAAGTFYSGIMAASTQNALSLAQQQALAVQIAELEARRADALGNCFWAGFLEGGRAVCESMVNDRFRSSLNEARRALNGSR